ncbi:MAG: hypothetical protein LBR80_09460 [Deltaproteobacteria bacterium]|jgi:hypothetical protein|nr:hypothetical protein [Deltaproteobacteria bacterium]
MPANGPYSAAGNVTATSACSKDSRVILEDEVPEIASKSLEQNILMAFDKLVKKAYTLPFIGKGSKV